jgi:hypothetical protein
MTNPDTPQPDCSVPHPFRAFAEWVGEHKTQSARSQEIVI